MDAFYRKNKGQLRAFSWTTRPFLHVMVKGIGQCSTLSKALKEITVLKEPFCKRLVRMDYGYLECVQFADHARIPIYQQDTFCSRHSSIDFVI